jgi:hypothetical protein
LAVHGGSHEEEGPDDILGADEHDAIDDKSIVMMCT